MFGIWKFITNLFGISSAEKSDKNSSQQAKKKIIVYCKVVKPGDTLYSIAKAYGVSVEALKEANGLKSDVISVGQKLRLPEKSSKTIFPSVKKTDNSGFQMYREISDEEIANRNEYNKYIKTIKNPDYTVKKGDTAGAIAEKFGVSSDAVLELNKLNEKSLQVGQKLKIPDRQVPVNIKNLNDVAKATGFSIEYLKSLEKLEEKHNKMYMDKNGVKTIGIGHVIKNDELKKFSGRQISNAEIYTLLAEDLLERKENIQRSLGAGAYKKMPQPLKDSVMDFVFNRGETVFENKKELVDALKKGDYKTAICEMDTDYSTIRFSSPAELKEYLSKFKDKRCFVVEKDGKTLRKYLSGLNKRRLYEISNACKIYNGKVPQEILNSAQNIYNRGLYFMGIEAHNGTIPKSSYQNVKVEYNTQVEKWFNGKLKLK